MFWRIHSLLWRFNSWFCRFSSLLLTHSFIIVDKCIHYCWRIHSLLLTNLFMILTYLFRIVTQQGNMNPLMGEVDMVPDEDLNTRLKFYVRFSFQWLLQKKTLMNIMVYCTMYELRTFYIHNQKLLKLTFDHSPSSWSETKTYQRNTRNGSVICI